MSLDVGPRFYLGGITLELPDVDVADRIAFTETLASCMSQDERAAPQAIPTSRRHAIALAGGLDVREVETFFKQFASLNEQLRQLSGKDDVDSGSAGGPRRR